MFDLALPPQQPIWLPPKPAIIRSVEDRLLNQGYLPATRQERRAALTDLLRRGVLTKNQSANAQVIKFPPAVAMLMVTQLSGFMAGSSAEPATISFTDETRITSDLSTYTFSTQAIGTAAADRHLIIGVGMRDDASVRPGTVEVDGNAATEIDNVIFGAGSVSAALYIIAWPTGTTADIVVTTDGGAALNCSIGVWAAYGLNSSTPTDQTSSLDNTTPTVSLSVSAGGVAVGYAYFGGNGAARTHTWAGLTEVFDATNEGFITHTGASDAFASADTPTISITSSGAESSVASLFASFR